MSCRNSTTHAAASWSAELGLERVPGDRQPRDGVREAAAVPRLAGLMSRARLVPRERAIDGGSEAFEPVWHLHAGAAGDAEERLGAGLEPVARPHRCPGHEFGDGRIDVNEAEAGVLQAATGITPEMVEGILQQRRGPDGIEPSEDDFRFEDVSQLAGWLAGSTLPTEQILAKLSTESAVKRIDSRGLVGERSRLISVVAASGDGGDGTTYLLWEEK